MQMIPSAAEIGQGDCETSRTTGARALVTRVAFTHRDTLQRVRLSIGRLENESREVSGKMDDVLARAAGDFEDDALRRQDITKDTQNEIAIAQRCRGILTGVVHRLHAFPELRPQDSRLGKNRRNRRMNAHWCCRRPRLSASNSIATCPFSDITASRGIAKRRGSFGPPITPREHAGGAERVGRVARQRKSLVKNSIRASRHCPRIPSLS
jgi:hypothetical protein